MASAAQISAVFFGGALGGVARYASMRLGTWLGGRASTALVFVNLAGCIAAGAVAEGMTDEDLRLFLIGGLLGGYTTLSAVALDCALPSPTRRKAMLEAALSIALAAPAVRLGMLAARGLA